MPQDTLGIQGLLEGFQTAQARKDRLEQQQRTYAFQQADLMAQKARDEWQKTEAQARNELVQQQRAETERHNRETEQAKKDETERKKKWQESSIVLKQEALKAAGENPVRKLLVTRAFENSSSDEEVLDRLSRFGVDLSQLGLTPQAPQSAPQQPQQPAGVGQVFGQGSQGPSPLTNPDLLGIHPPQGGLPSMGGMPAPQMGGGVPGMPGGPGAVMGQPQPQHPFGGVTGAKMEASAAATALKKEQIELAKQKEMQTAADTAYKRARTLFTDSQRKQLDSMTPVKVSLGNSLVALQDARKKEIGDHNVLEQKRVDILEKAEERHRDFDNWRKEHTTKQSALRDYKQAQDGITTSRRRLQEIDGLKAATARKIKEIQYTLKETLNPKDPEYAKKKAWQDQVKEGDFKLLEPEVQRLQDLEEEREFVVDKIAGYQEVLKLAGKQDVETNTDGSPKSPSSGSQPFLPGGTPSSVTIPPPGTKGEYAKPKQQAAPKKPNPPTKAAPKKDVKKMSNDDLFKQLMGK